MFKLSVCKKVFYTEIVVETCWWSGAVTEYSLKF